MVRENRKVWLFPSLLVVALGWTAACGSSEQGEGAASQEPSSEPGEAEEEKAPKRAELEGPPIEGFKQLMPRGGIPALFDPQFVTAEEAEVPDEAWVMGFEHGGQAYAYDLNILNSHEVVNHEAGGVPIAAVW